MFICKHFSVPCACNTHRDQKRVSRAPRAGVLDGCKLGTELGPLQEQHTLITAEPFP